MMTEEIVTARLVLIAITAETLASEQAGDGRLAELIGCEVGASWPPVDWEPHVFLLLLAQMERHPETIGWNRYVALRNADGTRSLIGVAGAFWREERPAECEVGYTILAPHEGKGLATEATLALIDLVRRDARIESLIAHTFPALVGSVRVMEKCGFAFEGDGEEAGTVRYRRWL